MASFLADRLRFIKPSPTLAITALAQKLKADGQDVISLGAGEPDFDTPDHIKQEARAALDRGETKYTAVEGTLPLRKAICEKFYKENNLSYDPTEIVVSTGAKQVIFEAFMATLNAGDEVIIPTPYWVSYSDMVLLFEGNPVFVPTTPQEEFKMSASSLEHAITSKTKWLILNSPSNPTGMMYTYEELKSLAEVLRKYPQVYVLADDIYEHLVFDNLSFQTLAAVAPDLKERILTVNGVSKTYAMTGWRIGFAGGPKPLINAISMLQSQSTSGACSIAQAAAIAALKGSKDFLKDFKASFEERRNFVVDSLNTIPGISCLKPNGAFYVYPSCQGIIGKTTPKGLVLKTDNDVAAYFLEEAKVAVVPGSAFGFSPYFRISYATSKNFLEAACLRIKESVQRLL